MALQKTINLPSGASGNYIRVSQYTQDHLTREASAHLLLYASLAKRTSHPEAPLCLIAKLRLHGDKFDQYLSTAALDALVSPGPDPVRDQFYAAVRVEPLLAGGGLTAAELDLSDATDV